MNSPSDIQDKTGKVIEEDDIARLVRSFYGRARQDALLGPIFAAHVENWEHHLLRIQDFWSSVIHRTGRYQGRPVPAHVPLGIDATHFDCWLELFEQTASDVLSPDAAAIFVERARMIAGSLELTVASHDGVIVPPGGRYRRREPNGT